MLLKLREMCAVLLAALAFAGCSDDDAASSLATNFDELEFSYEESDQQLLIRSTVPWTLDCTYLTGDGWLAFDKTSGPGDEGIVSQRVTIKALHNTGVERTAELHITGAGFDRKVTVVQEDGQVRIDGVELEGDMAKDEQVEKTYIAVNYSRAVGGEKLTVTPTLSGEGSDGLSVAAGEVTLDAGSGVARMAVTGTPTTFGEVLFKVAVELGDKSFGPYEVKSETANRMAAPTGLYVFRADSHEIIMEWDNDHSTVRTRKWAWQLLDSDADDAGVVREFTYEVNSNDDKNPKYVYNRFIIGALDPGTTYYFRVKRCPSEGVADDAGKIDSKWTELCPVTTKAEPEVPADAVLFQDFRYLAYGGNNVYTAFAGDVNDNPTGKALDQIFVPYEKYCNANSAAANLWTTHSAAYRSAVGLDGWVGGNNAAGHTGNNSVYGATGMLKRLDSDAGAGKTDGGDRHHRELRRLLLVGGSFVEHEERQSRNQGDRRGPGYDRRPEGGEGTDQRETGDEALYGERRRRDGRDAHRVQCGLRQGERAYQPLVPRQRPDRSGRVIRAGVSESGTMVREGCGPQKPRLSLFW